MTSPMKSNQPFLNKLKMGSHESEARKQYNHEESSMMKDNTSTIESSDGLLQIQVSSTFDADMILRKIIEDRSAILAIRSEADRNDRELLKAKAWQIQTSEQLSKVGEMFILVTTN